MIIAPTTAHLSRAYYELAQLGARAAGAQRAWPYRPTAPEELLALCADLSRYDPRLLDILVEFWARTWQDWHPIRLRAAMRTMTCPQSVGVLMAFLTTIHLDTECLWYGEYLARGLRPVPTQLYFHHLATPGGAVMDRIVMEGLAEFRRWGFIANHRPTIAQANKQTIGHYDRHARHHLLQQWLHKQPRITIREYLGLVHHSISRQQAYLDLQSDPDIRPEGRGRGARWVRVSATPSTTVE